MIFYSFNTKIVIGTCLVMSCFATIHGQLFKGAQCTTKRGTAGLCKTFADCPQATRDVKNGIRPKICGFEKKTSIVCCAEENTADERRLSDRKCWLYSSHVFKVSQAPTLLPQPTFFNETLCAQAGQQLVIGGVAAAPMEFPHMVNLGFGQEDSIVWKCGATLISDRWLLTAAHCLQDKTKGPVAWARLGDLVLDSDEDSARPQTIKIVERVAHPQYRPPAKYHDVALARLEKAAVLSGWVRPACLDTDPMTVTGGKAVATGWGLTHPDAPASSKVLMKVTLPYRPTQKCNETYQAMTKTGNALKDGILEESMICAGDEAAAKDTCLGDSGGPLQKKLKRPLCMYSIVGVTSFGVSQCGSGDKPSIYTRVSHYLDWIEGVVWPGEAA